MEEGGGGYEKFVEKGKIVKRDGEKEKRKGKKLKRMKKMNE